MGGRRACIRGLATKEKINHSTASPTVTQCEIKLRSFTISWLQKYAYLLKYYVHLGMHKTEAYVMCHCLRPTEINRY